LDKLRARPVCPSVIRLRRAGNHHSDDRTTYTNEPHYAAPNRAGLTCECAPCAGFGYGCDGDPRHADAQGCQGLGLKISGHSDFAPGTQETFFEFSVLWF
jgi:hypothetical protein